MNSWPTAWSPGHSTSTVAPTGHSRAAQRLPGRGRLPQGSLQALVRGAPVGDPVRVAEEGSVQHRGDSPCGLGTGRAHHRAAACESANFIEVPLEVELTVIAPDDGPESIWDVLERVLRKLLDWLGSLCGGR